MFYESSRTDGDFCHLKGGTQKLPKTAKIVDDHSLESALEEHFILKVPGALSESTIDFSVQSHCWGKKSTF
jgi:hypothetical protein